MVYILCHLAKRNTNKERKFKNLSDLANYKEVGYMSVIGKHLGLLSNGSDLGWQSDLTDSAALFRERLERTEVPSCLCLPLTS